MTASSVDTPPSIFDDRTRYSLSGIPFKAMVDWQIKKMGKEIFYAHYMNKDE